MTPVRFVAVGACLAALVACSATDDAGQRNSLVNTGLFTDLSARKPRPEAGKDGPLAMTVSNSAVAEVATDGPATGGATLKRMAFVGESDEGAANGAGQAAGASFRLNFENADIREVVQAVLGETLKLNYTMTEDVSGKVTISSPRAMTNQELLAALESALNATASR